LMKPVDKSTTQMFVLPGSECRSDEAGIAQVLDYVLARETGRHHRSRVAGLHFKIRDEQHKPKCRIDIESRDLVGRLRDDREPAEKSRRGVIRVSLQFRT